MNSFVIVSKSSQKSDEWIANFCKTHDIDSIDTTILNRDSTLKKTDKKPSLSIGIEDVKDLQRKLFYKPIKSKQKLCIIQDAQFLTLEAQNSMLKILEEPPSHTLILLTTNTKESLLPTILSRCQTIDIHSENKLTEDEKKEINEQIKKLQTLTIAESLSFAENLSKTKDESTAWMENMIIVLREKLLNLIKEGREGDRAWYIKAISEIQKSYITIKTTNINLRMTLENLLLSIRLSNT